VRRECEGARAAVHILAPALPLSLVLTFPEPLSTGLNSEQLALLDFLILARTEKFVGFGPSTFSFYLREHRILHGMPAELSVLVNASKIGTDEVFSRSARWGSGAGSGACRGCGGGTCV
jgi:hypothetical protein